MKRITRRFSLLPLGAVLAALAATPKPEAVAQSAATGDVTRGEYLFTSGYKCFACHGYTAQTGDRRLVPLNYSLAGFTALVQNSPFPQMPSFNDVPAEDLAAIFAYIQTIPADAPEVSDVELLRSIAEARRNAFER